MVHEYCYASNSNHRLKSAVNMPMHVLKIGDLCVSANLDLFRMHLHRQPNANTKLDLRSPIVYCKIKVHCMSKL